MSCPAPQQLLPEPHCGCYHLTAWYGSTCPSKAPSISLWISRPSIYPRCRDQAPVPVDSAGPGARQASGIRNSTMQAGQRDAQSTGAAEVVPQSTLGRNLHFHGCPLPLSFPQKNLVGILALQSRAESPIAPSDHGRNYTPRCIECSAASWQPWTGLQY